LRLHERKQFTEERRTLAAERLGDARPEVTQGAAFDLEQARRGFHDALTFESLDNPAREVIHVLLRGALCESHSIDKPEIVRQRIELGLRRLPREQARATPTADELHGECAHEVARQLLLELATALERVAAESLIETFDGAHGRGVDEIRAL